MRAHYLQHVPFEGLGSIESWLLAKGYEIGCTRFYESEALPDPLSVDFLIIMGGPMSVNDVHIHPWLAEETRFIRTAVNRGIPVLGICLGAQLIASALGGTVFPGREKEIGWFPVFRTGPEGDSVFPFPSGTEVFHWHGETFSLPEGARLLAESEGCRHQAFQVGRRVMGLQFHPETTPETARTMTKYCGDELIPQRFVRTGEEILAVPSEFYQTGNRLMEEILTYLTDPSFS